MNRVIRFSKALQEWFIGVGLLVIALILFCNVVLRYIFNSSIEWAEELTRYGIVWITFIGASVCIYKGAHLGIDTVLSLLSKKGKRNVNAFVLLLCILFCLIFLVLSFNITLKAFETGQVSSTMGVPMYLVYGVMPVSAILMSLNYLSQLVEHVRRKEESS
ncbi:TRAP transporter small permease [Ammoniphilus sp. CFH 90114]|uniref:TRAP transporter small permease n=1 Tax=Ammoniphilus sp. CFH 90114 TaxID=2493665 RepID=UPI00100F9B4A|nr:TRAP transporter small permease [Ammoniphilus sp. CFH 90114]RXT06938.1 TRAP transporter small permease [Ammoniphilus sp. CFH 90114]